MHGLELEFSGIFHLELSRNLPGLHGFHVKSMFIPHGMNWEFTWTAWTPHEVHVVIPHGVNEELTWTAWNPCAVHIDGGGGGW